MESSTVTVPPRPSEEELASREVAYTVLNDIFVHINEQLRFAEAKNGALFSLNFAAVLAAGTILGDHASADTRLPISIENWLIGVALCLGIAALVCLFSFFPETRPRAMPAKILGEPSNIFFTGHIGALNPDAYVKRVFEGMDLVLAPLPAHLQIAGQMGTNSQIAHKKFECFAVAMVVTFVAILWSSALLVFHWLVWGL